MTNDTLDSPQRTNDAPGSSPLRSALPRGSPQHELQEAAPPRPIGPFSTGQVLAGTYQIGAVLGAGGMGVVYEAHDLLLDRTVAVKAPLVSGYGDTLRNEAVALAAVHHPNLVVVHALGREGDVEFMVMERVFGMTLEDRLAEAVDTQPISLEEALTVLVAIADALTAIHRAGLSHRDVKSGNVMLNGRRVVLADFGLATPEVGVRAGAPVAGSVGYMAPELILGRVRPGRGPQVDLYALGVVAFELLTGHRPFERPTTHRILMAHIHEPVPDVHTQRRDLPDELSALLHDLLAKAPEDRPESSEAVLWRLQAVRARLPRGPAAGRPFSVLIVDDDPDVGILLKRRLEWTLPKLVANAVTDPEKALEKIRRQGPDIALVDLNMPGMNGVELCMNIGTLPRRARPVVVAMSGRCSYDDLALLRSLDVYDFVNKDESFVPRMCDVIGDVRRARLSAAPHRPRRTR
jgi:eukaryotic-like serine/threonine-protein kinase